MVPFNGAILWHVCTRHKRYIQSSINHHWSLLINSDLNKLLLIINAIIVFINHQYNYLSSSPITVIENNLY